jgi:hypothetical protein
MQEKVQARSLSDLYGSDGCCCCLIKPLKEIPEPNFCRGIDPSILELIGGRNIPAPILKTASYRAIRDPGSSFESKVKRRKETAFNSQAVVRKREPILSDNHPHKGATIAIITGLNRILSQEKDSQNSNRQSQCN